VLERAPDDADALAALVRLALDAGAPVKRLALKAGETYSGDASASLKPAEPFAFLPAKPD
jgi:hypothetical protein